MSMTTTVRTRSRREVGQRPHTNAGPRSRTERVAITSWDQVDSVLRELAELQAGTNKEIRLFKEQVKKGKNAVYEIMCPKRAKQQRLALNAEIVIAAELLRDRTESLRTHRTFWETMLKRFVALQYEQFVTTERHFRFGSIYCHSGEVDILLNVDYAEIMLGKP